MRGGYLGPQTLVANGTVYDSVYFNIGFHHNDNSTVQFEVIIGDGKSLNVFTLEAVTWK